ncbi:MAG: hypothetical protein HC930_13700, partial [Hydrococcus sp. SU_1_0]|nr:hypothetical protein [Hydrococcus sp. SU_1_0]
VPKEDLIDAVLIRSGMTFSRKAVTESSTNITERLGEDGYAFANVNAVPSLDREKRQVAFTFLIDPGRRVYVRRIGISGNTNTRDEVIRREMILPVSNNSFPKERLAIFFSFLALG